jgi:hypothetical protein
MSRERTQYTPFCVWGSYIPGAVSHTGTSFVNRVEGSLYVNLLFEGELEISVG